MKLACCKGDEAQAVGVNKHCNRHWLITNLKVVGVTEAAKTESYYHFLYWKCRIWTRNRFKGNIVNLIPKGIVAMELCDMETLSQSCFIRVAWTANSLKKDVITAFFISSGY